MSEIKAVAADDLLESVGDSFSTHWWTFEAAVAVLVTGRSTELASMQVKA